ncbi:MAG: secondary thiamine-phosphate synthase enzyme YjbQ [Candidatus Zixiibacteriota bacterium]
MIHRLNIRTTAREEFKDVTSQIESLLASSPAPSGLVICFVPHTTAGITINENADPDVRRDLLYKLKRDIPRDDPNYRHGEGNSDAHLKASLMGSSVQLIFEDRHLVLGTWQAVYFCEFDGPRTRELIVRVVRLA